MNAWWASLESVALTLVGLVLFYYSRESFGQPSTTISSQDSFRVWPDVSIGMITAAQLFLLAVAVFHWEFADRSRVFGDLRLDAAALVGLPTFFAIFFIPFRWACRWFRKRVNDKVPVLARILAWLMCAAIGLITLWFALMALLLGHSHAA